MQQKPFDKKAFRGALGQFPTGVTIVTTRSQTGEPIGMTASSFNTVSLNPPLILWSIDHRAHSLEIFTQSEHFAVNFLGEHQKDLSNRFASTGADKFKGTEYCDGIGGVPLLADCVAQLECKTWQTYDGGDHTIIIGEVMDYRYDDSQSALLFYQGDYAAIRQD